MQLLKRLSKLHLVIVIILAMAAIGVGGWYILQGDKKYTDQSEPQSTGAKQNKQQNSEQPEKYEKPTDSAVDLVIPEWGVRVSLPTDMERAVTYVLGEPVLDPDGNTIQAAKIFIKTSAFPGSSCATTDTALGESINTGAQYIRSESSKPFNAERYRWSFKENILMMPEYNYHLNYSAHDCLGSSIKTVEQLQESLKHLEKME